MDIKEKYYLFIDDESGEDFYVLAPDKETAITIAKGYFEAPQCLGTRTDAEAEMDGLDVY